MGRSTLCRRALVADGRQLRGRASLHGGREGRRVVRGGGLRRGVAYAFSSLRGNTWRRRRRLGDVTSPGLSRSLRRARQDHVRSRRRRELATALLAHGRRDGDDGALALSRREWLARDDLGELSQQRRRRAMGWLRRRRTLRHRLYWSKR